MDDHHIAQWIGNGLSVGALVSTILGWLPAIGAVVAIVWYVIQITESDTFQKWRMRRHIRRVARLEARLTYLKSLEYREDA